MTTIDIKRTTFVQPTIKKTYWKTYAVFGVILGISALLNVVASVESMYSSNNAQEFEFKKAKLTAEIQALEKEKSQVANLRDLQNDALASGFTPVTALQYAETPMSQAVAQR